MPQQRTKLEEQTLLWLAIFAEGERSSEGKNYLWYFKMPATIVDVCLFSTKFIEANPGHRKPSFKEFSKGIKFLETNKMRR